MGIDEAQTCITMGYSDEHYHRCTLEFQDRGPSKLGGNSRCVWNTGEADRRKLQGVPQTSTNALIRPLIYMTAGVAGIPKRVVTPFFDIMEGLRIRNTLTFGNGATLSRRRGAPQGCPFSMTFTALLVRPWIIQVQKRGAIPRVLADDLHIVAAGGKHYETYWKAIRGGRIIASKSYAYSTDKRTRKRLHNTRYDILPNAKVPVVTYCRDLEDSPK